MEVIFETIMNDEARSKFIRDMMGAGMSRDNANQIIDLAIHAELSAMRAWERVIHVAGNTGNLMPVMSLSLGMIEAHVKVMAQQLYELAIEEGAQVLGNAEAYRSRRP
jgi:aspartate oxidase